MLFIIVIFVGLTIFHFTMVVASFVTSDKHVIYSRLHNLAKKENSNDELSLPLYTRVIKPVVNDISRTISNIMPSEIKIKIERRLAQAGNPLGFSVNRWIFFQFGLIAGFPIFTVIVALKGEADIKRIVIIIILEVIMGIFMPRFMLSKKIVERQNQITSQLPDILDLLTVSVEAGLGFDAALSRVVDKVHGQLSNEFLKAIQEIKVGTPRREALRNMAKRVNVTDLTTFIGSIIQADQLGVSIGNVLRIQSQQMRQKRRQRAQEKAMKAPIKMLFPLVFFIFPTIFAVLLGPIAIRMMDIFGNK